MMPTVRGAGRVGWGEQGSADSQDGADRIRVGSGPVRRRRSRGSCDQFAALPFAGRAGLETFVYLSDPFRHM
jgi:hypothetical protein